MNIKTTELENKQVYCPSCNKQLDGITSMAGETSPCKGDITICLYCATILEFEDGNFLHEMSEDDISKLKMNHPGTHAELMSTMNLVKHIINEKRLQKTH